MTRPVSTGLAELVDGWVISSEVAFRKPDPAIFRALAPRLHCPLQGWMIGDSLEHDVAGGVSCGLLTAWISAEALAVPAQAKPAVIAGTVASAVAQILGAPVQ
jgi:FMN phosphatase YigB (HAD superfamily)